MSTASPITAPRRSAGVAAKHPRHPWLRLLALVVSLVVLAPVFSLSYVALSGTGEDWPHLVRNVLPGASVTTFVLLAMVAVLSSVIGVGAAWMAVAYEFPFRRTLSWALVLPLAVPAYLAAYAFGEFFHYSGPVQTFYRALFGFQSARDYWFPDIRSTTGCALVLASVLYPYVYLTTRIVFLMQGRNIADVARTLGARPAKVFWRVLLPVARPAIMAGVALVLMETINDIGAAEYLGVRTLTVAVYQTWLARGSLEGGAQIALIMLRPRLRHSRRGAMGALGKTLPHRPRDAYEGASAARRAQGCWGPVATLLTAAARAVRLRHTGLRVRPVCAAPARPVRRLRRSSTPSSTRCCTASITAAVTVVLALFLLNAVRLARSADVTATVRLASIGYAPPGGILGLGLLFVLARFDNTLDGFLRSAFDHSTGLLLTGSAAGMIIACTIRFVALAEGRDPVRSRESCRGVSTRRRAASAARRARARRRCFCRCLKPAILTAAVLVFVDTAKELSATILLRPFGFSTLATQCLRERLAQRAAGRCGGGDRHHSGRRWRRRCCSPARWRRTPRSDALKRLRTKIRPRAKRRLEAP